MKQHPLTVPLALLLCLTFACQRQGQEVAKEHKASVEADVAAVRALIGDWVRLYNARDFDRLMSVFYAEDSVLMSPGAPARVGKEAILLSYQKDDKLNDEHVDSSVVEDVRVSGDLAVARGRDTGTTTPRGGGEPIKYSLKWLIAFARQSDGTWKCIDEIWNDNPSSAGSADRAGAPLPQDQALLTGRFDLRNPSAPVFSHVSSSIKANFRGTGISAAFSSAGGTSYLLVIIDGKADPSVRRLFKVDRPKPGSFALAEDLPAGDHQVEVVKENPYDTKVAFHGFAVTGGALLPKPARPSLSIEFYGDSNPAGHSAYDVFDKGAVIDNGGYFTYPGIVARLLNAEYHNISMGGVGITDKAWRNLVRFYNLIHMNDPAVDGNLWNFGDYVPAAVIINVGSNDVLAGAPATDVKEGWKAFILKDLRRHYPHTHIALVESYGWSHAEPANCLEEAVSELNVAGERNVSCVRIPWLWGQEHAVVNEHAGFANIVARHLADQLHLPQPPLSDLSSFAPYGGVANGSFEKSTLPGVADGWRPQGAVTLVKDGSGAVSGANYLKLGNGGRVHFANDARAGLRFTATAWMRGGSDGAAGRLAIEFKDQDQKTIASNEGRVTLKAAWQRSTTVAVAPAGVWSVWVVLAGGAKGDVFVDDVQMTEEETTAPPPARRPF